MTLASNSTCFKEEQHSKEYSPIEVTEEGIDICFNDMQLSKACSPIEVTEEGIIIFCQ